MYFDELKKSMNFLGSQKNTIFIGQAVEVPGTAMSNTLSDVPKNKLLELPVAEEMQMGMTLGLAMDGNIPISIFPRWNFLLYGMNQLINHIDKHGVMTGKKENGDGDIRRDFPGGWLSDNKNAFLKEDRTPKQNNYFDCLE